MTTTIGTCLMFSERRIRSEGDYRRLRETGWRKSGTVEQPQEAPLRAGLDCGVWLAWCACNAGVGIDPRWAFAACSCGRSWSAIVFPDAELLERIDAVLSLRPPGSIHKSPTRFYSWHPDETLADLVRENARRGWPIPESQAQIAERTNGASR